MENKNLPDLIRNFSWGDRIFAITSMLEDLLGISNRDPLIDIQENGDELILSADIPGFDPRDLDITVNGNAVIIKGDSRREEIQDQEGYYFASRSRHSFYHTIPLPAWVKSEKTVAQYSNNVLKIKMIKGKTVVAGFKPLVESVDQPLLE